MEKGRSGGRVVRKEKENVQTVRITVQSNLTKPSTVSTSSKFGGEGNLDSNAHAWGRNGADTHKNEIFYQADETAVAHYGGKKNSLQRHGTRGRVSSREQTDFKPRPQT